MAEDKTSLEARAKYVAHRLAEVMSKEEISELANAEKSESKVGLIACGAIAAIGIVLAVWMFLIEQVFWGVVFVLVAAFFLFACLGAGLTLANKDLKSVAEERLTTQLKSNPALLADAELRIQRGELAAAEQETPTETQEQQEPQTPAVSAEPSLGDIAVSQSTAAAEKKEKLRELQELFGEGFITEEEYEQKRKQILGL
ncbi:MAG: SHOCT domain-containing protein [Clostridia bacterium]|nr:SHOCT domain-containing protein [Clostridia bacterium]